MTSSNRELTIAIDDFVTVVTDITKQLVEMSFTVSQTTFLIMLLTEKWFLALSANKVFHVPSNQKTTNEDVSKHNQIRRL